MSLYQSQFDQNVGNEPDIATNAWSLTITNSTGSLQWTPQANAALQAINVIYPVGSGPSSAAESSNVYLLPNGFLRQTPQDPKGGQYSWLGGPSNAWAKDWEIEGAFLITSQTTPIILRFVADVTDVASMDDMFCEGLGARVALEVCEELTQATSKINTIAGSYNKFMGEARAINGIETGSVEAVEDDYVVCRL